jgi:hypothetical protein
MSISFTHQRLCFTCSHTSVLYTIGTPLYFSWLQVESKLNTDSSPIVSSCTLSFLCLSEYDLPGDCIVSNGACTPIHQSWSLQPRTEIWRLGANSSKHVAILVAPFPLSLPWNRAHLVFLGHLLPPLGILVLHLRPFPTFGQSSAWLVHQYDLKTITFQQSKSVNTYWRNPYFTCNCLWSSLQQWCTPPATCCHWNLMCCVPSYTAIIALVFVLLVFETSSFCCFKSHCMAPALPLTTCYLLLVVMCCFMLFVLLRVIFHVNSPISMWTHLTHYEGCRPNNLILFCTCFSSAWVISCSTLTHTKCTATN